MEQPTPSSRPPSPSTQQQEDAARKTIHRTVSKLDALFAMLEGKGFERFRQLAPELQSQYLATCADFNRETQAAWLQLETLRIMRGASQ